MKLIFKNKLKHKSKFLKSNLNLRQTEFEKALKTEERKIDQIKPLD